MERKDYYAVLGVPRTASTEEIRRAYRRLARQHHPDVNPGNKEAEQRFKEVNEAHEVLSDPEKRQRYDQVGTGRAAPGASGRGGPDAADVGYGYRTVTPEDLEDLFGDREPFSDYYYDLFGGRVGAARGRAGPTRGEDLAAEVEVSLEEAFAGATRVLELPGPDGRPRRLEAKIPSGVDTGTRVRLAGQGGPGAGGGPPGDLYLVVTVRPHARFRREGADLRAVVSAPFTTLALGGEVEVPTLTGRVMLRVPAGTADGREFRLAGQGMPGPGGRGDLYAELHAAVPSAPSPRERELLEELARLQQPTGAGAGGGG